MTAELHDLLDRDPAAGILAVADLRERRCDSVTRGDWYADERAVRVRALGMEDRDEEWLRTPCVLQPPGRSRIDFEQQRVNVVHAAAEANPAHALAAVAAWRKRVERHERVENGQSGYCRHCYMSCRSWPCPDLTETANEARAYLGPRP